LPADLKKISSLHVPAQGIDDFIHVYGLIHHDRIKPQFKIQSNPCSHPM
jgi:hypothetical protein